MSRFPSRVFDDLVRGPRPVVLIDGGAGAGKTTLAQELATAWPIPRPQLVSMDDLYPGWDGLAAGSERIHRDVLRTAEPGYWQWDWHTGTTTAWVPLDATKPLIVEGCGALTPATRAQATAAIWVSGSASSRRDRAEGRIGDGFAGHWEQWAAQERDHWRRHRPRSLADWIYDGIRFHAGPARTG
ncbi:MAG: cobalt ABC transporter [Propioniciclava sp.]